jgi:hypothetical protein
MARWLEFRLWRTGLRRAEADGKFVLPGASKQALKDMPEFEYASR